MRVFLNYALLALMLMISFLSYAKTPIIELRIKNHLFYPAEVVIPANKKIKLLIINQDPTPEEFESYELNREKVIVGHGKAIIFIGPLDPGEYPFFGEFNISTALGTIIAQ